MRAFITISLLIFITGCATNQANSYQDPEFLNNLDCNRISMRISELNNVEVIINDDSFTKKTKAARHYNWPHRITNKADNPKNLELLAQQRNLLQEFHQKKDCKTQSETLTTNQIFHLLKQN